MNSDPLGFILERLRNARVEADPFPHYYLEGVLPPPERARFETHVVED
jgi:hypothetical protein